MIGDAVMRVNFREIVKAFLWLFILVLLFMGFNFLAQPVWMDWNNYDTVRGFYEEPKDTIEVAFFGTSCVVNSISPMELYENYGICAYNFGTEQQPLMASYYWIKEAYRKHAETLSTVVLDVSALRYIQDSAFYRKAIEGMEFSSVKYNAVKDYSNNFRETIANLLPLYAYHDRWKSMNDIDFQIARYLPNVCVRGYNFTNERYLDSNEPLLIPSFYVNSDEKQELIAEGIDYFERIVDFCDTNELNLVLVRLASWQPSEHNTVKDLAEAHGLELLDFSFEPLLGDIGYNWAVDSTDAYHANYYGAKKITAYIGDYLKTNYQLMDVRENEKYSYMAEQLDKYHALVSDVIQIKEMTDPSDYLSVAMQNKNYTIFVMAKDDAASRLTQEQRERFAVMGLAELAALDFRDSYLAVVDQGKVSHERRKSAVDVVTEPTVLSHSGELVGGTDYALESGGLANNASCLIDGIEYAKDQRGLNIVIYDNSLEKVIDTTYFDTYLSSVRDGENLANALDNETKLGKDYFELSAELQKLYLYNRRCENQRIAEYLKHNMAENGIFSYFSSYWKEDYIIYMSVMDEAAGALDTEARARLADYGLYALSDLGYRDSYLAVVNSGQIVYEMKNHDKTPISLRYIGHTLKSGGMDSEECRSSIVIDGVEYSPNTRGINIVVYDTVLKMVVDTAVFDTSVSVY